MILRRSLRIATYMGIAGLLATPLIAQQVDSLIADGHYLRARPMVQAALRKNANDVPALIQSSVLAWAFAHYDEAISTAEKAVSLADKNAEAHTQLTNALGAKLVGSNAGTFEKMSLARRFRKEADLSVELDPKSIDALEDSARFYQNAPGVVGGDKAKAQELANRVVSLDPARGAALKAGFLADDKDKAKRDAAIEALWRGAVAAQPGSADAQAGLGAIYFTEGKLPLAEAADRKAIALKPSKIAGYRQLSALYATAGRWDDLEKLLKQARTVVPDDLSPDYAAAKIILSANSTDQMAHAEGYLRAYLAQPVEGEEPSHAGAHWRLGLVLEKEGRKSEAVQEVREAVRQDGSLDDAKKDLKRMS